MKRRNGLLKVVTLVLVFCLGIGLFTGCAAPEPATSDSAPEPMVEEEAVESELGDRDWIFDEPADRDETTEEWNIYEAEVRDPTEEITVEVEEAPVSEGNMGPIPIILASETGRELVYTTDIKIETIEFMEGQRLLLNKVTELGGHSERTIVNGRSLANPETQRDMFAIFRLPPENLIEFIIFIEDHYNLVHLDKKLTDFTIAHERNVTHLEELIEQEERLLAELEEEQTTRNQRELERDLDNIRANIRDIEAESAQLAYDVALCDITIFLSEFIPPPPPIEPQEPPTFGERIGEVTQESLIRLVAMLQGFLLFLIRSLPWLLPITAIAIVAYSLFRRTNKKKGNGTIETATITAQDNTDSAEN